MAGRKRTYTDSEKATALAALDANEGNVSGTAKQTGIPRKTLDQWSKERFVNVDVANIRQVKKRELSLELEDLAYTIAGVMPHFAHSPFNKINELSTALGTVIDKMRLLRGESTVITENRENYERLLQSHMKEFNLTREQAVADLVAVKPESSEYVN
jgi:hypothetical protein